MCELDKASGLDVDRGLEVGRGIKVGGGTEVGTRLEVCWDDNTAVYIVAIEASESRKKTQCK